MRQGVGHDGGAAWKQQKRSSRNHQKKKKKRPQTASSTRPLSSPPPRTSSTSTDENNRQPKAPLITVTKSNQASTTQQRRLPRRATSAGRSRSPVGAGAARLQRGKTFESSPQSNSLGRVPTSSNSSQHHHPLQQQQQHQQQQQQQQRNRLAVTTLRLSEGVSFMRSSRLQQMPPIRLHAAVGGHGSGHGSGNGSGHGSIDTTSYAAGRNNFSSGSLSHSGSGSIKTRYHDQQEKRQQDNGVDGLSFMTASVDSNGIHDTSILSSYQNFSAHTNI